MEIIGSYTLDGARFDVFRVSGGFRFVHTDSGVRSVVMLYHEVVQVLIDKPYQRIDS